LVESEPRPPKTADDLSTDFIRNPRFRKLFFPTFFFLFGILWSGVGYFFQPNWQLEENGITVKAWPFGLWLIGLGFCETFGLNLVSGGPHEGWRFWILLLWALSFVMLANRIF